MKILGSDYDGTFTVGGIDEKKISAIRKWQKAGNKFGIVSGRNGGFRQFLLEQYPELKLDFFIGCNGAYILDEKGDLLYTKRCEEVSALDFAKTLLSWGSPFVHIVADKYRCAVTDMKNRPSFIEEKDTLLLKDFPPLPYFHLVSVECDSPSGAAATVERIRAEYGEYLNPMQNAHCLDVVPIGVNKATGLYRVMEYFGGAYEDVIAVGDNFNDMDMIKEFRSYAMANGVEEIKATANGIVTDIPELIEKEL